MAAVAKPSAASPRKGRPMNKKDERALKRKRDQDELEVLEQAISELDPKTSEITKFASLPLCKPTASGLRSSHFEELTDIQARAIPLALKGSDVLGAAKTGSGKTLAFLVPVLEKLYRAKWTEFDGLGALIISPTRELAVQIFGVLQKIGRYHNFSAGLVIGGKNLRDEAERLGRMNILVCTPGRMLQHLDQTAGFNVDNLQILVLDEADRIMDMGFEYAVDALIEHLPKSRQTLLFSATQSKKISDLARLSLKDPEYVSVHEAAATATPSTLQQHWTEVPLPEKLDTLYAFVKANLKSKIMVFLSSAKQVRFVYEMLRHLRPGIPLLHLHGRQKQEARLAITQKFRAAKYSCLLATDVVARGIDFPAVDWVVQVDAPEDVDTYVHRVGRTARYESKGRAVLFLDPSEAAGMLKRLEQKKIPIQKANVREKRKKTIGNQLQDICFKFPEVKYLSQKAFISYAKSIHRQRDKEIFNLEKLDLDAFAASLGLPGTPQIRFRKGEDVRRVKNASRDAMSSGSDSDGESDEEKSGRKKNDNIRTKYQKMAERTNQDVFSEHYKKLVQHDDEDENSDQEFFAVKRVLRDGDLDEASRKDKPENEPRTVDLGGKQLVVDSNRREKLLKSKKKVAALRGKGEKLLFDDDGEAHAIYELQNEEDFKNEGPAEKIRQDFVEAHSARARENDVEDKLIAKQRRKEKRDRRKARERAEMLEESAPGVQLAERPDGEEREDPLALLRSLPLPGETSSDSEGGAALEQRPRKKSKRGHDSDVGDGDAPEKKEKRKKRKSKVIEMEQEPETLEDYEALAAGLLDG